MVEGRADGRDAIEDNHDWQKDYSKNDNARHQCILFRTRLPPVLKLCFFFIPSPSICMFHLSDFDVHDPTIPQALPEVPTEAGEAVEEAEFEEVADAEVDDSAEVGREFVVGVFLGGFLAGGTFA